MKTVLKCLVILLVMLIPLEAHSQVSSQHRNISSKGDFEKYLKQDLETYFNQSSSQPVTVKFQFLRDGPTITGISYPKYYLWVYVYASDKLIDDGAVRVAEVDEQFEITDFLSRSEILFSPEKVSRIFPAPLIPKIKDLAGSK